MNSDSVKQLVEASLEVQRGFFEQATEDVLRAGDLLSASLERGGKVLAFGNGGSAADAQHFAAELVGRYRRPRRALAAISLTTDTSTLTAIGNDDGFGDIFARQVEALGREGDVALAISTSGRSENVVRGVEACRRLSIATIGLTGRDGGQLTGLCEPCLVVADEETSRIQEVHAVVIHLLCRIVEDRLCPVEENRS